MNSQWKDRKAGRQRRADEGPDAAVVLEDAVQEVSAEDS